MLAYSIEVRFRIGSERDVVGVSPVIALAASFCALSRMSMLVLAIHGGYAGRLQSMIDLSHVGTCVKYHVC